MQYTWSPTLSLIFTLQVCCIFCQPSDSKLWKNYLIDKKALLHKKLLNYFHVFRMKKEKLSKKICVENFRLIDPESWERAVTGYQSFSWNNFFPASSAYYWESPFPTYIDWLERLMPLPLTRPQIPPWLRTRPSILTALPPPPPLGVLD